ncbi:MAG TPA: hypothetical protein VML75_17925 [Kofleriaceae bacterium]|nr:hypothetical protein [Kofleriaceae bacterium]
MQILQGALLMVALVAAGLVGCKKDAARPDPASSPTPVATPTQSGPPASAGVEGGTVLETMDAGGYTYARLDTGGAEVWVAGPTTALSVGQRIGVSGGSLMKGFHSQTLDRTFPEIYFVAALTAGGHAGAANPHAPPTNPHGATAPTAPPVADVGTIAPAKGGKKIADLFAEKDALNGKPVVVRGKVVKFNAGIMGRNWIHLQDGSGAAGTNDLTVTTAATAAVGDVITVSGTLATDRDFGGGYSYAVIVEDAALAPK